MLRTVVMQLSSTSTSAGCSVLIDTTKDPSAADVLDMRSGTSEKQLPHDRMAIQGNRVPWQQILRTGDQYS